MGYGANSSRHTMYEEETEEEGRVHFRVFRNLLKTVPAAHHQKRNKVCAEQEIAQKRR